MVTSMMASQPRLVYTQSCRLAIFASSQATWPAVRATSWRIAVRGPSRLAPRRWPCASGRSAGHPCRGRGRSTPCSSFFDFLRPVVGRAGIGVGVQDRPEGPTAERPQVVEVDAARRMLEDGEERCSGGSDCSVCGVGVRAPAPGVRAWGTGPAGGLSVIPSAAAGWHGAGPGWSSPAR
jgi:hypothetical protein